MQSTPGSLLPGLCQDPTCRPVSPATCSAACLPGDTAAADCNMSKEEQRKIMSRVASKKARERRKQKSENMVQENARLLKQVGKQYCLSLPSSGYLAVKKSRQTHQVRMLQSENHALKALLASTLQQLHVPVIGQPGITRPSTPAAPSAGEALATATPAQPLVVSGVPTLQSPFSATAPQHPNTTPGPMYLHSQPLPSAAGCAEQMAPNTAGLVHAINTSLAMLHGQHLHAHQPHFHLRPSSVSPVPPATHSHAPHFGLHVHHTHHCPTSSTGADIPPKDFNCDW